MNLIKKAIEAGGDPDFFELSLLALEEDRLERPILEVKNGKQLKKTSTKNGKTRHSDVSFSTEHESKQTA